MEEKEKMAIDGNVVEPKSQKKWWKSKTGWQKTSFIISMILLALALAFVITLLFAYEIYGTEFARSIYGQMLNSDDTYSDFTNTGDALLYHLSKAGSSIILSLVTIAVTLIIAFFLNYLIKLISINGSKRTKTTLSLVSSLIKYIAVIVDVGVLLTLWGVDVLGVVASIGVLTLIIGLGCQSLIADIVSGLFIVFDDYFSVGDMVIVDGFRGYIVEIGLRAVKINDNCGNIKSINNGSISSVVNLSRQPNYISITMAASYFEDVERLEAVFARELPLIKERLPQIVDGPWYKGIDSFSDAGIEFNFAFTTNAEYRFQATRDFKREIYQMFVRNDIIVPFKQVTVNQPDPRDRPKASDEDLEQSKKVVSANRAKKAPKKKKNFSEKLRVAYDETVESVEKSMKGK